MENLEKPFFTYDDLKTILDESRGEHVQDLLERLLENKERFDKVFKTRKGSTYFVLGSGESVRIKKSNVGDKDTLELQPIAGHIFFIDEQSGDLLCNPDVRKILNAPIKLVNFEVGATPLEVDVLGDKDQNQYELTSDTLVFWGTKLENGAVRKDGLGGRLHVGNHITEIIK